MQQETSKWSKHKRGNKTNGGQSRFDQQNQTKQAKVRGGVSPERGHSGRGVCSL